MDTKLVRVDLEDYRLLKSAAFYNESNLKTIFSEIMAGKLDPRTIRTG